MCHRRLENTLVAHLRASATYSMFEIIIRVPPRFLLDFVSVGCIKVVPVSII